MLLQLIQVKDILTKSGQVSTHVLKIDEVNNLGAARIRIRSLISAVRVRKKHKIEPKPVSPAIKRVEFTKEMREELHTVSSSDVSDPF